MKIETKFDVNDKVYFVKDNKISKGTIYEIKIDVSGGPRRQTGTNVNYCVWNGSSMTTISESKIFATIDELTASLVGEYRKGAKR